MLSQSGYVAGSTESAPPPAPGCATPWLPGRLNTDDKVAALVYVTASACAGIRTTDPAGGAWSAPR